MKKKDIEKTSEIYKICNEYIKLDKKSPDYKRYSYFLSLYFRSHNITDDLLDLFKKKKKLKNKDAIINSFNVDFNEILDKKKLSSRKNKLDSYEFEIKDLKKKKYILTEIYNRVCELNDIRNSNFNINECIKNLKCEYKKFNIKDNRKVKAKIDELRSSFNNINYDYEIDLLYEYYTNHYVPNYVDNINFDTLDELYDSLVTNIDIVNEEIKILDNRLELIKDENDNYNIDVSDLYERIG